MYGVCFLFQFCTKFSPQLDHKRRKGRGCFACFPDSAEPRDGPEGQPGREWAVRMGLLTSPAHSRPGEIKGRRASCGARQRERAHATGAAAGPRPRRRTRLCESLCRGGIREVGGASHSPSTSSLPQQRATRPTEKTRHRGYRALEADIGRAVDVHPAALARGGLFHSRFCE